jgi:hypothetical protein
MLTIETMKWRLQRRIGEDLPLLKWTGTMRVVGTDDQTIDLLVGGRRVAFTWDRVRSTWERLLADQELSVAELGGQEDAVAMVSLLAVMQADEVVVDATAGVLRLSEVHGKPVHQPVAPTA